MVALWLDNQTHTHILDQISVVLRAFFGHFIFVVQVRRQVRLRPHCRGPSLTPSSRCRRRTAPRAPRSVFISYSCDRPGVRPKTLDPEIKHSNFFSKGRIRFIANRIRNPGLHYTTVRVNKVYILAFLSNFHALFAT